MLAFCLSTLYLFLKFFWKVTIQSCFYQLCTTLHFLKCSINWRQLHWEFESSLSILDSQTNICSISIWTQLEATLTLYTCGQRFTFIHHGHVRVDFGFGQFLWTALFSGGIIVQHISLMTLKFLQCLFLTRPRPINFSSVNLIDYSFAG